MKFRFELTKRGIPTDGARTFEQLHQAVYKYVGNSDKIRFELVKRGISVGSVNGQPLPYEELLQRLFKAIDEGHYSMGFMHPNVIQKKTNEGLFGAGKYFGSDRYIWKLRKERALRMLQNGNLNESVSINKSGNYNVCYVTCVYFREQQACCVFIDLPNVYIL